MNSKIIVIISTGEASKARIGAMYAVNALKNAWMEDVKLVFFGPSEELLLRDKALQSLLYEYQSEDGEALACKFIAENEKLEASISELGVEVKYVGKHISDLIHDGYIPMVW